MTAVDDAPARPAGRSAAATPVPDRAALARAALHRAEERAGVRTLRPRSGARPVPFFEAVGPTVAPAPGQPGQPGPRETSGHRSAPLAGDGAQDVLPVHPALAPLLPQGVLRRGTTVAVQGSTGLLLALVAQASQAGAWTAAVGLPAVGLLAATDAGVDLARLALVPRPGPDAAAVVAALVDGMDVVVIGPEAPLLDNDRRRLVARARERGALLVPATPWSGAHVTLVARAGSWSGADRGAGWLRRRTLVVERAGRAGAARPLRLEVELPVAGSDWPAFLRETSRAADPTPADLPGGVAAPGTSDGGPGLERVG